MQLQGHRCLQLQGQRCQVPVQVLWDPLPGLYQQLPRGLGLLQVLHTSSQFHANTSDTLEPLPDVHGQPTELCLERGRTSNFYTTHKHFFINPDDWILLVIRLCFPIMPKWEFPGSVLITEEEIWPSPVFVLPRLWLFFCVFNHQDLSPCSDKMIVSKVICSAGYLDLRPSHCSPVSPSPP